VVEPLRPARQRPRVRWRLWLGYLADLVIVTFGVGAVWVIVAAWGASPELGGLLGAALAGMLVVGFVEIAWLWGWRGTGGMRLAGVAFVQQLSLRRAAGLWLAWLFSAMLLGLPLLLGGRAGCLAEKLAGLEVRYLPPHGSA
jgi:hypothetical protein